MIRSTNISRSKKLAPIWPLNIAMFWSEIHYWAYNNNTDKTHQIDCKKFFLLICEIPYCLTVIQLYKCILNRNNFTQIFRIHSNCINLPTVIIWTIYFYEDVKYLTKHVHCLAILIYVFSTKICVFKRWSST